MIREAAEREAAEIRARLESMFGELGRLVTDYFDEMLAAPAMPMTATPVAERPASSDTMPAAPPRMPETRPSGPSAKPTRRGASSARPSARPAAKPVGRQAKAMKKMAAAFVVASLIGAVSGTTELMLHGYPFFIFRANGAGGTETGPREPANPPKAGQSFLPSAHHGTAAHHTPTTSAK